MEAATGIYTRIVFPDMTSKVEPHLSDLQKAMLDATPDCIKVVSVDGKLLTMNRAGCLALNVPEDSDFGMPWLPLLPAEVHPLGMEALRKAAAGQPARFPGKSISANGIIYWDNLLTPVVDISGEVLSILCVSRDVTEKVLLEKQLEEAIDRERLLSNEMHHRIKNLFSVVSGLIRFAEKEAGSANTPEAATSILREKLGAFSRASDAAFAETGADGRNGTLVSLEPVIRSVLQPYGDCCALVGSTALIRHNAMTAIVLLLHELATNAVKYGALSIDSGNVTIRWTVDDDMLNLTWIEIGDLRDLPPPEHQGFGTEMVDRIVRSAGGTIDRAWRPEGLVANLHLPNSFCN